MLIKRKSSGNDCWVPDICGTPGLYRSLGGGTTPEVDLLAGDVIPFSVSCWVVVENEGKVGGTIKYRQIWKDGRQSHDWSEPLTTINYGFKDVLRPEPAGAVASAATPKPVKVIGHWNGKCVRCGSNTYTGAFKVEHENPDCR